MEALNVALWILEILLALAFLAAGIGKVFINDTARARMPWTEDFATSTVRLIGAVEILGAIGVVAPRATGILPWLTPLAGLGLAIVMLLAIRVHVRRHEPKSVAANAVLALLALAVAFGTYAVA